MGEISRRRALAGALTLSCVAAACGSGRQHAVDDLADSGDVRAPEVADVVRIGASDRVRGVCIGPGKDDFRGDSSWTGLWQRWDWAGRIKNEMEDAVRIGANCVRLIGNTHVITNSVITEDQYLERWSQFLDYADDLGLWVYPCGGDLSHWGGYTTLAAAESIYRSWAGLLGPYDHVIGVDVTNEAPSQSRVVGGVAFRGPESWLYTVERLGEIVRSESGKPITHSRGLPSYDSASWQFGSPETDTISDFLDVHAYRAMSPDDAEVLYTSEWGRGKQLIIGEFGANMTLDSAARTSTYEGVRGLISQSANCIGGLAWAIYDTGTDLASQYGLYDTSRTPRGDIARSFGTFPVAR
jgi:hypothetical protein